MTRAPNSSSRPRRTADCDAARVITIVLPLSAMLGDFGKNFSGSLGKEFLPQLEAQFIRTVKRTAKLIGDDTRSVKTRDQAFDDEPVSFESCSSRNWNLATTSQSAQESAFGRHCSSRRMVIQGLKCGSRALVARPAHN